MKTKSLILILIILLVSVNLTVAFDENDIINGTLFNYYGEDSLISENTTSQSITGDYGTFTLTKYEDINKRNDEYDKLTLKKSMEYKAGAKLRNNGDEINYKYAYMDNTGFYYEVGRFEHENNYYLYVITAEEPATPNLFINKLN
ncbi:hypothetical protein [Methanobrevibacter sp. DSM 116169]|uniref:hypothetical protein n=1 Tax=Methanobrevibacter sp. DSM 116169 TaxID=3242727 RepID=UPI0038FD2399